jgi:hypothetical protein
MSKQQDGRAQWSENMQKWEHLYLHVYGGAINVELKVSHVNGSRIYPTPLLTSYLAALGQDRWEMFSTMVTSRGGSILFLKRPRPD